MLTAYKAIKTSYIPASNVKGSRVKAVEPDGKSVTVSWDDSLDTLENHAQAAYKLCEKLNWTGKLQPGGLKDSYVWVFLDTPRDRRSI